LIGIFGENPNLREKRVSSFQFIISSLFTQNDLVGARLLTTQTKQGEVFVEFENVVRTGHTE
jgi:hypothetical protein